MFPPKGEGTRQRSPGKEGRRAGGDSQNGPAEASGRVEAGLAGGNGKGGSVGVGSGEVLCHGNRKAVGGKGWRYITVT